MQALSAALIDDEGEGGEERRRRDEDDDPTRLEGQGRGEERDETHQR